MLLSPLWIQQPRALAIDPSHRGFGFAVLEGSERLIDWGLARVWAKSDKEWLARVEALIDRYEPKLLVVEDVAGSKRGDDARRRIKKLKDFGRKRGIDVAEVSREEVRVYFENSGIFKNDIALAISRLFPELESYLPRRRKLWTSEDLRMDIFDAVSFALVALGRATYAEQAA